MATYAGSRRVIAGGVVLTDSAGAERVGTFVVRIVADCISRIIASSSALGVTFSSGDGVSVRSGTAVSCMIRGRRPDIDIRFGDLILLSEPMLDWYVPGHPGREAPPRTDLVVGVEEQKSGLASEVELGMEPPRVKVQVAGR
ncbi:unnamed protein product [Phytophthora fragariaefolia]|uniref:Unnamed protein product n=1 Tax=Phytophthora fragariaefolia TaxID=1490495 RepID=A0A9W6TXP5_9STRA|nr:unnamed protein product [Phytophthora fragariaefolia]